MCSMECLKDLIHLAAEWWGEAEGWRQADLLSALPLLLGLISGTEARTRVKRLKTFCKGRFRISGTSHRGDQVVCQCEEHVGLCTKILLKKKIT